MLVIAVLPGCAGQAADAASAQKESPLCWIDGHLSSQTCGVWTKVPKVQRQSRAPWSHCERRLWSPCSLYWARIVSLANDCCKSNWCYCESTMMRWTSSGRSISLHPNKNGGRSKVDQHSKVRLSRSLDTSTTTQVPKLLVEHRRPSGSFWTKSVWSPTCWITVGKTIW